MILFMVKVTNNVAMRSLSAAGSRKLPIIDCWFRKFLAMYPSIYIKKTTFLYFNKCQEYSWKSKFIIKCSYKSDHQSMGESKCTFNLQWYGDKAEESQHSLKFCYAVLDECNENVSTFLF